MSAMELYQLKGFAEVAEQGHLTRAADKLHVSQPALSAQIKALEEELGVELFERIPGGMALTVAGKRLLVSAQNVIAAAQTLLGEAHALRGEVAGHVRLGTLSDPDFVRLPDLLARAVEQFPLLEIELHHEVTGAAFEKVRDGALDASFYYGDLSHPEVGSLPLCTFDFCVVAPARWRRRIERADFAALAGEPWILTPPISTHRMLSDRLFQKHGVTPATSIEADNETVIRSLVVAGLGVALMRADLAQSLAASREACIWKGETLTTTLQFIWRAQAGRDPLMAALRKLVRAVWPEAESHGA
jgi:DNA-binding transcriptional LysR family regulator